MSGDLGDGGAAASDLQHFFHCRWKRGMTRTIATKTTGLQQPHLSVHCVDPFDGHLRTLNHNCNETANGETTVVGALRIGGKSRGEEDMRLSGWQLRGQEACDLQQKLELLNMGSSWLYIGYSC